MISLLTCTADRPKTFELCKRWTDRMVKRYYQLGGTDCIEWIIVDGGYAPINFEQASSLTSAYYYRNLVPGASPLHNFLSNMLLGLLRAKGDKIFFIEDDDYYKENYLYVLSLLLGGYDLVGEGNAIYYHPRSRGFHIFSDRSRTCLSHTAITNSVVPKFKQIIKTFSTCYLDKQLWSSVGNRIMRIDRNPLSISMKGLPGKQGFEYEHNACWYGLKDVDGQLLKDWIGEEDAQVYLDFYVEDNFKLEDNSFA